MFGSDRLQRDGDWVYAVITGSVLLMCLIALVLGLASFFRSELMTALWQILPALNGATVFVIDLGNLAICLRDRRSARGREVGGAVCPDFPIVGEGSVGAAVDDLVLIIRCLIGLVLLLLCALPLLDASDAMSALPLILPRAARAGLIYFAAWLAEWAVDVLASLARRAGGTGEGRVHHGR